jgi:hypothetical protein
MANGFTTSPQPPAHGAYSYQNYIVPLGPTKACYYVAPTTAPYAANPSWDTMTLIKLLNAMSLHPPTKWYMDTDASAHMSSDVGILNSITSRTPFSNVVVGASSSLPSPLQALSLSLLIFRIVLFTYKIYLLHLASLRI